MARDLNTSLRFGFLIHDVSRLRRVVVDRSLKPLGNWPELGRQAAKDIPDAKLAYQGRPPGSAGEAAEV